MPKDKCSQVGTAFGLDRPCGAWANRTVDGKPYCRHHPASAKPPRKPGTLIEDIVWDALKNSRCPGTHRYKWPSTSLPCRWCRTAHAVMLVLQKIKMDKLDPDAAVKDMENQLGWSLESPVVGQTVHYTEKENG